MNANVVSDAARQSVEDAGATFHGLIGIAQEFLDRQQDAEAIACAQIAGLYGSYNHPGEFVSHQLEDIIRGVAARTVSVGMPARPAARAHRPYRRVLHVLTAAKDVGGDSRFVWRWIERDPTRCHSVALTEQLYFKVPAALSAAVGEAGGRVHVLDLGGVDVSSRARVLRGLASEADVVFLHIYPEDVVPLLAFADRAGLPAIVFVVQADHQLWLGATVCDAFVHLRESGMSLSEERRGIPRERMPMLPIPLEPVTRSQTRAEAKRQLGVPEDRVLLLSIARAVKYTPVEHVAFPDVLETVLRPHPHADLLVLGPGNTGAWAAASERTNGRLRALGQRSDTAVFYQAADIYLDSFPFASNTSLLEAGGFGVPLVTYFPYAADADVVGAGSPGIDGTMIRASSLEAYGQAIAGLISDRDARERLGEETREQIHREHGREAWERSLQVVYQRLADMPLDSWVPAKPGCRRPGEGDVLLSRLYAGHKPLGWIVGWYARHLPYWTRLRLLTRLVRVDRTFSFSMFLPDSLSGPLAGRLKGWRRWPGVSRLLLAERGRV